jgi:PAS domain-containing protein
MGERADTSTDEAPSFSRMAEALGLGMAFQIKASPDGRARTFAHVSDSCRSMTGVDPDAALADPALLYATILPEYLEALAVAEAEALAAMKTFDVEVRMRGPDGDVRWRRIVSTPRRLADGSTLWDGLLQDVTDQRRAEIELSEQRRRLEAAVEATGLGLW